MGRSNQRGQSSVEFVLTSAGVVFPLTFMIIFTAQLLWTWHSAVEWTREGARYAATHCYQGGENVRNWMRTHVPTHMDQQEFAGGTADITINYYTRNVESGALEDFSCDGSQCSADCIPDAVSVSITGYQFRHFMSYLGLPPVQMPSFLTSMPIESAGCDPDAGECLP
jgi:hypothetical protein